MSYILDALRRAEAERERGAVPSLASQQHSIEVEEETPQRSRVLVWAVIGLASALVATLAWTLLGGPGTPTRPIAEGPVTIAPAPAAPAAVPQSLAEIAATPTPTAVPTPAAAPAPAPAPSPSTQAVATTPAPALSTSTSKAQAPARAPATRHVAAKAEPPVARAEPKAEPKKSGTTTAALAPSAAASEPRVYAQSELPEDIRRQLPRVAINGSSYSGDAASRMVMVNGQVFHEGDQLAAGLVLDKIRRRSAVLAFKGFRYEVMF